MSKSKQRDPAYLVPTALRWCAGLQLDSCSSLVLLQGLEGRQCLSLTCHGEIKLCSFTTWQREGGSERKSGWAVEGVKLSESALPSAHPNIDRASACGVSLPVNTPGEEIKLTRILQRLRALWHVTALG